MFSVLRRKDSYRPWVGLLARRVRIGDSLPASPSPTLRVEWYSKRVALTHSGGTAPDLHRTSLSCPTWATEGRHGCITGGIWLQRVPARTE